MNGLARSSREHLADFIGIHRAKAVAIRTPSYSQSRARLEGQGRCNSRHWRIGGSRDASLSMSWESLLGLILRSRVLSARASILFFAIQTLNLLINGRSVISKQWHCLGSEHGSGIVCLLKKVVGAAEGTPELLS